MFIHLGSFLENHAHFLTAEMGKVYTRYRTELLLQPYPLGRHIPIFRYIREYPPAPCLAHHEHF